MPTDFQNGHLGFEVQLDNSEKKVKSFKNVKKTRSFNSFLNRGQFSKLAGVLEEVILRKKSILN